MVFKAKTNGVATITFNCDKTKSFPSNVKSDTNITGDNGVDVVDCTANNEGSYIIGGVVNLTPVAGGVGDVGSTRAVVTKKPVTRLPQTGTTEVTIGLTVVGLMTIGAGLLIKLL